MLLNTLATLVIAALSATSAIAQTAGPPPTIGLSTIGIKITNVTGKARDWVGIFPHGAPDNAQTDWVYIACDAKTCAATSAKPGSTATLHLVIPANAGLTDFRYFTLGADGKFKKLYEIDPDLSPH